MNTEPKLVSIIMPTYNSVEHIGESIESVINQTYKNWELIIVDDGSIDGTGIVANKYAEEYDRITYIYQRNQKQGKARNTGIKNCKGELIAFLDSDDLWIPEKLEIQVDFLKNNKVDILFSDGYIFQNDPIDIKGVFNTIAGFFEGDNAVKLFLIQNRIPILSAITTKHAIEVIGGFEEDEQIQNVEDYHLWLKLLIEGFSFFGMPDKLVYYRQHENQVTSKDPWSSEKVFIMLSNYVKIPQKLKPLLIKAQLNSGKDWYFRNGNNKKSAFNILIKLLSFSKYRIISIATLLSLIFCGVTFSKRVMNKLVKIRLK